MMSEDRHNLNRFVDAQRATYERALDEIRSGRKRTHWMWFVFPQLEGLGRSDTARFYAISDKDEATAFLAHPVLGARLRECAEALLQLTDRSAAEILGSPDDAKLRSSATLFAAVSPQGSVFHRVLDRFFDGAGDDRTLELLSAG